MNIDGRILPGVVAREIELCKSVINLKLKNHRLTIPSNKKF